MTGTSNQGSLHDKPNNNIVSSAGVIKYTIKEQTGSNGGLSGKVPPLPHQQRQKRIFKFLVDFGG